MSRRLPLCAWCGESAPAEVGAHDLTVQGGSGERVVFRWHDEPSADRACLDADPWAAALGDVASMPDGPRSDFAMRALYLQFRQLLVERHGVERLPGLLRVRRDLPEPWRTLRAAGARWGLPTRIWP